ncbi:Oidioi.mRNA.OKI2018_I69.chr2.g7139.t1.cds [Oikopleura dioica]|uniref:Oidioi.mRNA.OKI2018_I69.chr2.g7139.t1.cds n=1 Tax=Oikopleura dioica TaxID=34765 RepID=A0ABN7TC68_OIKDI|nr:Oidioi.mRNA.OKI2018_I69.chr2.g7139.t1.cds [Oikopleura dioica]
MLTLKNQFYDTPAAGWLREKSEDDVRHSSSLELVNEETEEESNIENPSTALESSQIELDLENLESQERNG